MKSLRSIFVTVSMFMLACGADGSALVGLLGTLDSGAPGPRLTNQPVGFKMVLDGNGTAAAPGVLPAQSATASTLAITSAIVNIAAIELDAPPDWDCGRYNQETVTTATNDAGTESDHEESAESESEHEDSDLVAMSGSDSLIVGTCELDEDGQAEITFTGPFLLDLVTGKSTPPLEDLTIPPGTYEQIDLEVDDVEDGLDNSHPMFARSVLAYGTYTTDTDTPIQITLRMGEEITFAAADTADGARIGDAGGTDIVVRIAANDWFAGVASRIDTCLAELADDEAPSPVIDGVLVLDDESESDASEDCADEVTETLEVNFKKSGELDDD